MFEDSLIAELQNDINELENNGDSEAAENLRHLAIQMGLGY